jgi:hypothetical protein
VAHQAQEKVLGFVKEQKKQALDFYVTVFVRIDPYDKAVLSYSPNIAPPNRLSFGSKALTPSPWTRRLSYVVFWKPPVPMSNLPSKSATNRL